MVNILKKLWLGFILRCPNCEQGQMSNGLFNLQHECAVCQVVFERQSGESVGGSAIMMMGLPIIPLILFFGLYAYDSTLGLPILLGVPVALTIMLGIVGYRHMRGVWVSVAYLTGSVYADAEPATE